MKAWIEECIEQNETSNHVTRIFFFLKSAVLISKMLLQAKMSKIKAIFF